MRDYRDIHRQLKLWELIAMLTDRHDALIAVELAALLAFGADLSFFLVHLVQGVERGKLELLEEPDSL